MRLTQLSHAEKVLLYLKCHCFLTVVEKAALDNYTQRAGRRHLQILLNFLIKFQRALSKNMNLGEWDPFPQQP